jgi:DNA repair photolyase
VNVPRTGNEILTCHYPLRVDTYSSCYFDCVYCYSKGILESKGFWTPRKVRIARLEDIKTVFRTALNGDVAGPIGNAIRARIPARLGGLTDCFQPEESKEKVTLRVVSFLNSIRYPYLIVTKSDLIVSPDYIETINPELAYVQVTITTLDNALASTLEPNAPPPVARLKLLSRLRERGIFAAARVSPIIPGVTEPGLVSLIKTLVRNGVPHLLFEFFRGTESMIKNVECATTKKVKGLERHGTYYRLRLKPKLAWYKEIARLMAGTGTTFSFCTDGDPVPYGLCPVKNCCGADVLKKFIPSSRFGTGNQKTAETIYGLLENRARAKIEDIAGYAGLDEKAFLKAWNAGKFTQFLPNSVFDKETASYRLDTNLPP